MALIVIVPPLKSDVKKKRELGRCVKLFREFLFLARFCFFETAVVSTLSPSSPRFFEHAILVVSVFLLPMLGSVILLLSF